jgi:phosphoribosylpyrophosphate synthetase
VFAGDALAQLANIGIERVLVSDTIEPRMEAGAKVEVVSVIPELAEALRR